MGNYIVHFRLHQECGSVRQKAQFHHKCQHIFRFTSGFRLTCWHFELHVNALNARLQLKLFTEHSFMPIKWFHGIRLSVHGCSCVSYGLDFVHLGIFFYIYVILLSFTCAISGFYGKRIAAIWKVHKTKY